jgi:hypothetical protein
MTTTTTTPPVPLPVGAVSGEEWQPNITGQRGCRVEQRTAARAEVASQSY